MPTTELSAETRGRILDVAWRRAREEGTGAVSVKAIARDAGVSRQLVYFHFGSRAGLLLAMARHRDDTTGFRAQVAATRELPPVEGFEGLVRAWCSYLPELLPVARALEAAHITGDEGGEAWADRIGDLHEAFRLAVRRVADDGRLAAGWTADTGADWAWARVQPSTFAHLVAERGWSPGDYTERTLRALLAELVVTRRRRRST
jgi:AcrR family transcriptional regulator